MIEVVDCVQGSPEWFACRAGIPTASEFATIMAKGKGNTPSVTRRKYMMRLLGEIITGKAEETYTNQHMERGKAMEDEARVAYAFIHEVEPQRIGFVRNASLIKGAILGYSPDSFVPPRGGVEIKTKLASIQLEVLIAEEVPTEHVPQLQGGLWVAELDWIDFVSYWPGLPPFIKRVYRDDPYIANMKIAVEDFLGEMEGFKQRFAA